MNKLVVVILGENCEKFIEMCLESVKDADAIVYCDGGSKRIMEYEEDFLDRYKAILIENTYNQSDPCMNGKQRNFYLKYLKENYPDDWCLVLDADEVVDDFNKIKEFIQTAKHGLYSVKMRHFIGDLGHEDATREQHFVPNRLFKISSAAYYPEIEHPVLQLIDNFYLTTKLIKIEPEIIFDLGARDCIESIKFAMKYPNSKVYAFECNPEAIKICKVNLNKYKLKNIELIEKAVSDKNGKIKFYPNEGNIGASSIFLSSGKYDHIEKYNQNKEIEVETIRLDDWAKEEGINKVDVLWADIQGAELLAFKGMGKLFNTVSYLTCEIENEEMYKNQPLFEEVNNFIISSGLNLVAKKEVFDKFWGEFLYSKEKKDIIDFSGELYLTEATTIWHLGYISGMFNIFSKYKNQLKKSFTHTKEYTKGWYYSSLFGQWKKKKINPLEIPNIILNYFGINRDELYLFTQNYNENQ